MTSEVDLLKINQQSPDIISDDSVKKGEQSSDTVNTFVGTSKVDGAKKDELGDDLEKAEKTKLFEAGDDSSSTMVDVTKEEKLTENAVRNIPTRRPRYFDPLDTSLEICRRCGEDHKSVHCTKEKPCFICGGFGHNGMKCTQALECFLCKRMGHSAKHCHEHKDEETYSSSNICLRCGEVEHDMWTCNADYPIDDVKDIQCYVCKSFGHLCCADYAKMGSEQVSCYKCGESGHVGSECTKVDAKISVSISSSTDLCHKCGERGHLARKCKRVHEEAEKAKAERDLLAEENSEEKRENSESEPGSRDLNEAGGRRNTHYEDRASATAPQPRGTEMWNVDGRNILVYIGTGSNVWRAPSTSASNNQEMTGVSASNNFSSPGNPVQMFNHMAARPSSQPYQPRFVSASNNLSNPQNPDQMFNNSARPSSSQPYQPGFVRPRFGRFWYGGMNQNRYR